MALPTLYPEWASVTQVQEVLHNGLPVSVSNKLEPTAEWKLSGELYQENLPYPYVNYQFDLIDDWVRNLDERAGGAVGDSHITFNASLTIGDLATLFGGTWVSHGSDTIAAQTVYLFERTV